MTIFRLDDITSEQIALDLSERLINEAIEAKTSMRSKSKKIRNVSAKIERVQMKCASMRWDKPCKRLKEAFDMLEEAKAEESVNLWGI
tara:strand:- start:163 stop:426 length:264 start_codon:yes stop_codon:yes gene_type:complete